MIERVGVLLTCRRNATSGSFHCRMPACVVQPQHSKQANNSIPSTNALIYCNRCSSIAGAQQLQALNAHMRRSCQHPSTVIYRIDVQAGTQQAVAGLDADKVTIVCPQADRDSSDAQRHGRTDIR